MTHSSSNCINSEKKQERNGLVYLPNETEPFSGKFCKTEVLSELNYKDGKKDGDCIEWHENGQKKLERNYKDGKRVGKHIEWYKNGQIKKESNYKEGKEDGIQTSYFSNGQKKLEGNYRDGKKVGVNKHWDENGQKHLDSRLGVILFITMLILAILLGQI